MWKTMLKNLLPQMKRSTGREIFPEILRCAQNDIKRRAQNDRRRGRNDKEGRFSP